MAPREADKPSANQGYGERTARTQAAPTSSSSAFRIVKSDARGAMTRPSIKSVSLAGCSKQAPTLVPRPLWAAQFYLQIARK